MKTKYLSILACVCMLALGFTSCEKQLDIEQHGVLDYSTFYQTDEEAEQAATAIYEQLRGAVFNYTMILNSLGDDFWSGGGARNDNADLEQFNEFTFGTEAGYVQGLFQTFYSVIYKCNVVLGHVEGGTAIQDRSIAEAHVLRAWAYFNLINLWGTPPIVDHELEASEYSRPNGTKEELWGLVVSDLETAINSGKLPEKSSVNDQSLWRTTKQFAQAMLGKAYMWQGNYSAAITQFEAVMSSGKYALYDDYENLLQYGHQRNCEMMFESNRVVDPNNVFNNSDIVPLMINWRTDKMTVPSSVGLYSTGWGFLCPQKSLYEDFVAVEGKDGYRLNATMKTFEQVQEMGCTVNTAIINEGKGFLASLKYSGLRDIENDLYEFIIRAKNAETEEEVFYALKQINARLAILDDYIRENRDDPDIDRWINLKLQYMEIRDKMAKQRIYNRKNYGIFIDYNQLDNLDRE